MMNSESVRKKFLQICVICVLALGSQNFSHCSISVRDEDINLILLHCHVSQHTCSFRCVLTRVYEHDDLMLTCKVHDFLVADLIHDVETFQSFLLRDSDVLLLKRYGTISVVKVKQTVILDTTEQCDILVVR